MAGLDNINPELLSRFNALQAAAQAAGTYIGIGSGYRSVEQQAALRISNGCPDVWSSPASSCRVPTAIPGKSNHNHGLAIDITGDKAWANANAAKFGLHFPVAGEDWHLEMIGEHAGSSADPHMQAAQQQGAIGFDLEWAAKGGDMSQKQDDIIKSYLDTMVSAHEDALAGVATPAETIPEIETPDVSMTELESPAEEPTVLHREEAGQLGQAQLETGPEGAPLHAGGEFHAAAGDRLGNARIIAQVGRSMGAPDQAIRIALAAALVESNLRNVNYGDRDSLGLFQQRPSQGWGSQQQVMDPAYAATQFFSRLLKLNWQGMDPGAAAQAVQRSAFPGRYAQRFAEASSIFAQL